MPRRGQRIRVLTGVYKDGAAFSICLKHDGKQLEERWPLNTTLDTLSKRRRAWRTELTHPATQDRTLADDIAEFLTTLPAKTPRYRNAQNDLGHWVTAGFGDQPRSAITALAIRGQLAAWEAARVSASSRNHRRQELSNVFTALGGRSGANPVRDVPRAAERRDEPRGVTPALVAAILAHVPDTMRRKKGPAVVSLTKLRLRVIATTGLPHAQLRRLQPRDFNARAKTIFIRPRRKGAGTAAKTLPLTSAGVAALTAFFRQHAHGSFSSSSMHHTFRIAVTKARDAWAATHRGPWPAPDNLRPYDLRHAFLTEAYRRTKDLRAVAELGLHADLKTTQRYAEAAVSETARSAVNAMEDGTKDGTVKKRARKQRAA
ncbi:MAG: tyrosine-type recombinase/integrase [Vicinamibacterales bacterium]